MSLHPSHAVSADGSQCDRCLVVAVEAAANLPCSYNARMAKRAYTKTGGYSKDFTPAPQGFRRYLLDRIPVPLWTEVQAKAKREKVSVRALILRLLSDWVKS